MPTDTGEIQLSLILGFLGLFITFVCFNQRKTIYTVIKEQRDEFYNGINSPLYSAGDGCLYRLVFLVVVIFSASLFLIFMSLCDLIKIMDFRVFLHTDFYFKNYQTVLKWTLNSLPLPPIIGIILVSVFYFVPSFYGRHKKVKLLKYIIYLQVITYILIFPFALGLPAFFTWIIAFMWAFIEERQT